MKLRLFFSLITIITISLPAYSAEKQRIAVLDLKAMGVPAATSQGVSSMLRSQLIDSGLFTVVERSQMDAILKEQGFQKTGCTDAACAVQIGKILSATKILIGEISRIGKTYIIACRVVDVEKGVAEFATDIVAENENKIYSSVKDLVYKLGKRIAGDVKPRDFGRAPQGFYLGYQHMFKWQWNYAYDSGGVDFMYDPLFGGSIGYLASFSQYFSISLDSTFAYTKSSSYNRSLTLSGIGGGARAGVYLQEKVYCYLGFSLQALLIADSGDNDTSYFGGISVHPQAGLNIMLTPDIGFFAGAGYYMTIILNKNNSKNATPGSVTAFTGISYNLFSI